MHDFSNITPIDYLIIGHITQDLTPQGAVLGGTASYAALTAKAIGKKVGIITSCRPDLDLGMFDGITIIRKDAQENSTFENIYTAKGRTQFIHGVADTLTLEDIPPAWRSTPVVHFGPIVHEISTEVVQAFPESIVGITPQGWMREWDEIGRVSYCEWQDAENVLKHADIAVMSIEDVHGDESVVQRFVDLLPILVVTEGASGARVYWNGDVRNIRPPKEIEVDPVGAGDIFATSFFIKYQSTRDPWEAARFATLLAANSVTRKTITGVPTPEEVQKFSTQIVEQIKP